MQVSNEPQPSSGKRTRSAVGSRIVEGWIFHVTRSCKSVGRESICVWSFNPAGSFERVSLDSPRAHGDRSKAGTRVERPIYPVDHSYRHEIVTAQRSSLVGRATRSVAGGSPRIRRAVRQPRTGIRNGRPGRAPFLPVTRRGCVARRLPHSDQSLFSETIGHQRLTAVSRSVCPFCFRHPLSRHVFRKLPSLASKLGVLRCDRRGSVARTRGSDRMGAEAYGHESRGCNERFRLRTDNRRAFRRISGRSDGQAQPKK
jgi:hypothetical protein